MAGIIEVMHRYLRQSFKVFRVASEKVTDGKGPLVICSFHYEGRIDLFHFVEPCFVYHETQYQLSVIYFHTSLSPLE